MSFETTPSSRYADWELPVSETEVTYWEMSMKQADLLLKETVALEGLRTHGENLGKDFEPIESYTVDGESVMWLSSRDRKTSRLEVTNGSDPFEDGISLVCECDFSYRVGDGPSGKNVFRVFKAGCAARRKLIIARQINISDSIGFDARNQFRAKLPFAGIYPKQVVQESIFTIVEAASNEGEWIGNRVGGKINVPTIQSILGMPRGSTDPETAAARRQARWAYFHELIDDGRLIADSTWNVRLPRKRLLRP